MPPLMSSTSLPGRLTSKERITIIWRGGGGVDGGEVGPGPKGVRPQAEQHTRRQDQAAALSPLPSNSPPTQPSRASSQSGTRQPEHQSTHKAPAAAT